MGSLLEWEVLSIKQRCGTLTPELKYCQCANVTEVWESQLLRCAGHGVGLLAPGSSKSTARLFHCRKYWRLAGIHKNSWYLGEEQQECVCISV